MSGSLRLFVTLNHFLGQAVRVADDEHGRSGLPFHGKGDAFFLEVGVGGFVLYLANDRFLFIDQVIRTFYE